MASCLIFRFLSHLVFTFVHGVRVCSSFIDLHEAVQFSQNHLLTRLYFSHFIFSPLLSKTKLTISVWVSFWVLYSIPLVSMSVFDCGFGIVPEVWENDASCLVFVPQDCFGNSGSFVVAYKFLDCLS